MSRRTAVGLAAVVVLALVAWLGWRLLAPDDPLTKALRMAPAETSRAAWTDWEGVRRELGTDVDASSSAVEVDEFLAEAFDRDLSPMSALGTSAGVMQEELGFSPATLTWELLAQSPGARWR